MLGLISDLRGDRAQVPAAALSRVRALGLFVYILIITDLSVRLIERDEQLLLGA